MINEESLTRVFDRFIDVIDPRVSDVELEFKASAAELTKMSDWLDVREIKDFTLHVTPFIKKPGKEADILYKVSMDFVQDCINTGDPLDRSLSKEFMVIYLSESEYEKKLKQSMDDVRNILVSADDFELMTGPKINVGDIALQYVCLEIDRFPKKALMDLSAVSQEPKAKKTVKSDEKPVKANPFEVLKKLK